MDLPDFFLTIFSSLAVSAGGAWYLARELIAHRLDKDRDERKGEIRREVESFLGDRAAEREYKLEAKKRLYQTIGPLRFQLLIASREFSNRIERHLKREFSMQIKSYYGKSTLYRLLRLFAICELIEKQLSYADFSVDPSAVKLLRFKKAAGMALASDKPILSHPNARWDTQTEHIFYDNLSRVASRIIIEGPDGAERLMNFQEFSTFLKQKDTSQKLSPMPEILGSFTIDSKPVLWLRLVCLGYICSEFVRRSGLGVGFDEKEFHLKEMINVSDDTYTKENAGRIPGIFREILEMGL